MEDESRGHAVACRRQQDDTNRYLLFDKKAGY
jgi:hypothetical protein